MSILEPPTPDRIRTATPSSVRAVNRSIVLELIRRRQSTSRADLARLTGIFRSSVSEIVDELVAEDLVTEGRGQAARGRTPVSLQLNDDKIRVLGLNIRPEYSRVGVAGLSGNIQHNVTFENPSDPDKLVARFAQAVDYLEFNLDERMHKGYKRVGIAVPGHVDVESGRLLWTPTHPEMAGFEIAAKIAEKTGMDVLVDNDCNLGALSELWLRSSNGTELPGDFVFLNVSDFGAGAGVVIGGETYRGYNGDFVAEFGHTIIDPEGPQCPCGRRGCWERFVCNSATWARFSPAETYSIEKFDGMVKAAKAGDEGAIAALRVTTRYLAIGLSNIAYTLNPSVIVIAGRIADMWDMIQEDAGRLFGQSNLTTHIRPARLSADDSLLHGAICLALREIFAAPKFG